MLENIVVVNADPYSNDSDTANIQALHKKPRHANGKYFKTINTFALNPIIRFLSKKKLPHRVVTLENFIPDFYNNSLHIFSGVDVNAEHTFTDPGTVGYYDRIYPYLHKLTDVVAECFSAQMFASVCYGAEIKVLKDRSGRVIKNDCTTKVKSIFKNKRLARFAHSNYIVPDSLPSNLKKHVIKVAGQEVTAWAYDKERNIYMVQDHPSIIACKKKNSEFEKLVCRNMQLVKYQDAA